MRTFVQKRKAIPAKNVSMRPKQSRHIHSGQIRAVKAILHMDRIFRSNAAMRSPKNHSAVRKTTIRGVAPACFEQQFHHTSTNPDAPDFSGTKFAISNPGDAYEQQADHLANQIMSISESKHSQNIIPSFNNIRRKSDQSNRASSQIQSQRIPNGNKKHVIVPQIIQDVLQSPGQPLQHSTRRFMEKRFGHDFRNVRIHSDSKASESARAINALAYTVGPNIVFGTGRYSPDTNKGKRLLAHELAHVIQHENFVSKNTVPHHLFRFVSSERDQIGNLDEVTETARQVADDTGMAGLMRWGRFTAAMGGIGAIEYVIGPERGSTAEVTPFPRYLYTCRCGLIDLRHFYQLMYISLLRSEEYAVEKGIEHEKIAEPSSAFAPEDITSNALGAEFGSRRSWIQRQSTFVSALRSFLNQCRPVSWHSSEITPAQRNCIVNYYAVDLAGGTHRRRTAGEDADPCNICRGRTNFPFVTDRETGAQIL